MLGEQTSEPEVSRIYVYVDGESHFLRSEAAWRTLHGPEASLAQLKHCGADDPEMLLVDERAKVFWSRTLSPGFHRAYYFTSASVDKPKRYEIDVSLRNFNLEPHVLEERSQLANRRRDIRDSAGLIEKPKGVDIELVVRMMEDAERLEVCHLYTSDIDFLPVIRAVRAKGKLVYVFGFDGGIASESPFRTQCDGFTDLTDMLRTKFVPTGPAA